MLLRWLYPSLTLGCRSYHVHDAATDDICVQQACKQQSTVQLDNGVALLKVCGTGLSVCCTVSECLRMCTA